MGILSGAAARRCAAASLTALSLLVAALLPRYPTPHARAASKPLLLIVAAGASYKDISIATLRRVFEGRPTNAPDGKRFIPLNQPPGSPARAQFDRALLGLEPNQVGAFWVDRRIRDEGFPPRVLPSLELALRVVASLPGAITYSLQGALPSNVRALSIDSKAAGQPGYLLK